MKKLLLIILGVVFLIVIIKIASSNNIVQKNPNEILLPYYGTINGYDSASGTIIDPVRIWSDYDKRTYAGTVRHGEKVKLIKRVKYGVLIEKKDGNRGWLTYFFINGLIESK